MVHTSGFLLHSLPCAQDLLVGRKTADFPGSTWLTGSVICSFSFLDRLQSGLLFGGMGGLKSQCSGFTA
eukprot:454684-Rhodomonas_salina.1